MKPQTIGELVLAAARRASDARDSGRPCILAERDLAVASLAGFAAVPATKGGLRLVVR